MPNPAVITMIPAPAKSIPASSMAKRNAPASLATALCGRRASGTRHDLRPVRGPAAEGDVTFEGVFSQRFREAMTMASPLPAGKR